MKIAITAKENKLDSEIDPRFGRCNYFLIIETETMEFESIANDSAMASGGAGIQSAQIVAKTGVVTVITGNIGPNAFQTLKAAGITVITGVQGVINEIIERYNKNELKETNTPSVESHFGMGRR